MEYRQQTCMCYLAWSSISPPPECPLHPQRLILQPMPATRTTEYRIPCQGRHCAHDHACYGWMVSH